MPFRANNAPSGLGFPFGVEFPFRPQMPFRAEDSISVWDALAGLAFPFRLDSSCQKCSTNVASRRIGRGRTSSRTRWARLFLTVINSYQAKSEASASAIAAAKAASSRLKTTPLVPRTWIWLNHRIRVSRLTRYRPTSACQKQQPWHSVSCDVYNKPGTYFLKPEYKLTYKKFNKTYKYYPLLQIYSFPTLIQLIDLTHGIQHYVAVVSKYIFDKNIPFAFPLGCYDL